MNIKKFNISREKLVAKASYALIANVALSAAVLFLVIDKVTEEPIVSLVPPSLTSEATIGASTANAEYLMSWGLYFASMTGNVTPRNVLFVADSVSGIVDARIYPEIRKQLYALAADPLFKERGGSVTFEAQDVSYDAPSGKVFVRGEQVSRTTTGEQKRNAYVYEIQMEMRSRMPVVVAVDHYKGALRTAKWMNNEYRRAKPQEARDDMLAQSEGAKPWFDEETRYGQVEAKQQGN